MPSIRDLTDSMTVRVTAGLAAAACALGGGVYAVTRDPGPTPGCEVRTPLRVAAAPEVAPIVTEVARRLSDRDQLCLSLSVVGSAPERVLADIGAGGRTPDVWIPDSTLWLTRAKQDKVVAALDAPAIATSPLVLTVPDATATALRAAGRPTVDDLVAAAVAGKTRVQVAAARLAPERVGTILALQQATSSLTDARAAFAALLRGAVLAEAGRSAATATVSAAAHVTGPAKPAADTAVTTSERAVWAANASGGDRQIAIYPGSGTYDYPYAVLTTTPRIRSAAGQLLDELLLPSSQSAFRSAGFRDAGGKPGLDLTAERGVDGAQAATPKRLDQDSLDAAEKSLAAVRLDARLLAVVDVSGSMAWPLTGRGGAGPSRLAIALEAAGAGLSLYPDSTEVALWSFSEGLGDRPAYTEVVPLTTLDAAGRATLLNGLTSLRPQGDTALYATTLAAVRAARSRWLPGRVNAVVVLSDGDDSQRAMSIEELVRTLAAEASPDQPVPVITIAFGPDAPADALSAISRATGGASYQASSAADIRKVFLDAMGQRACRPHCA